MGRARKESHAYTNIKRVLAIRDNYFHCIAMIRTTTYVSDPQKLNLYQSYINDVKNAFYLLDPLDKRIIKNDFFNERSRFWWITEFSKSTYYRLRSKAIENFLRIFYE